MAENGSRGGALPVRTERQPPPELTWGLQALQVEALWRRGLTGAGVRVGHLDTGVAGDHPALAGRVASFLELDEEGRPVATPGPRDTASHGTHTAGIICGGTVRGLAIGVAPEARLHSAAVIDGGWNVVRILRGLDWLRGSGVRVLNLPLGIPSTNPVFWTLLEALRAEGTLTICPIGNNGSTLSYAPASYPGVLSVGAIDMDMRLASYTGCDTRDGQCRKPEVLAPGAFIWSANPHSEEVVARGGTSQASAFTTGVASLLFQAHPEATPEEVASALVRSAEPIDERHGRRYRFGLLQPLRALELLGEGGSEPAGIQPMTGDPPYYRDPELSEQRRLASPEARLPCVLVASCHEAWEDERGAAGPLMDRVTRELGEEAEWVEYLPVGRIAIVLASPRLVEALSREPGVVVLSAARVQPRRSAW